MVTHKEALVDAAKAYCTTGRAEEIEVAIEAAIRAYLDARGLVMVPKVLTEEIYDALHRYASEADTPAAWDEILSAAPNPFGDAP